MKNLFLLPKVETLYQVLSVQEMKMVGGGAESACQTYASENEYPDPLTCFNCLAAPHLLDGSDESEVLLDMLIDHCGGSPTVNP